MTRSKYGVWEIGQQCRVPLLPGEFKRQTCQQKMAMITLDMPCMVKRIPFDVVYARSGNCFIWPMWCCVFVCENSTDATECLNYIQEQDNNTRHYCFAVLMIFMSYQFLKTIDPWVLFWTQGALSLLCDITNKPTTMPGMCYFTISNAQAFPVASSTVIDGC